MSRVCLFDKTGAAKSADFIDNTLVTELEREGFFRQLYR
jgi:hypothetical protein